MDLARTCRSIRFSDLRCQPPGRPQSSASADVRRGRYIRGIARCARGQKGRQRWGFERRRLLDVARSRALNGYIPAVRIPSLRARDGRVMRRILIDSRDPERLIERWKEVDNSEANPT